MKILTIEFAKYLAAGAVNTLISYIVYVLMLQAFSYSLAYSIGYFAGIVAAFVGGSLFVFRKPVRPRKLIPFSAMHVVLCGLGIFSVWVMIEHLRISPYIAAIMAAVLNVPLSYVFSRAIITNSN